MILSACIITVTIEIALLLSTPYVTSTCIGAG